MSQSVSSDVMKYPAGTIICLKALAAINAGVEPMQAEDIREARFYVVDELNLSMNVEPLSFEEAFRKAEDLSDNGGSVRVLYTDEASQMQLTRFSEAGIRAGLAPQG